MKVQNRKTGEIVDFRYLQSDHVAPLVLTIYENGKPEMYSYNSLAELNSEWEDAPEEPKEFWFVDADGEVRETNYLSDNNKSSLRSFGNYFSSREEAQKAAEKLKAWKRLKDKGSRFELRPGIARGEIRYYVAEESNEVEQDLQICFGGEE